MRLRFPRKTRPTTIACWGFLGAGNIGNDASFQVFADWLRTAYPHVQLHIISTAPHDAEQQFGVRAAPLTAPVPALRGLPVVARKAVARVLDVPWCLIVIPRSADVVVVAGMGVMEDSMYVPPWGLPLLMLLTALGCRLQGRRFALVDIGAEFAGNALTRRFYTWCIRLSAHVSVRDELSARVIGQALRGRPVLAAPDLVFAYPATSPLAPANHRVAIGVISAVASLGERGKGYQPKMVRLIGRLLDEDLDVVLVGGDRSDVGAARSLADDVVTSRGGVPRLEVATVSDYAGVLNVMSSADVVVATRYHNLVAALQAGRPTASISYATKCTQLLDRVGLADVAFDLDTFDPASVAEAVIAMLGSTGPLSRRVRDRTAGFDSQVRDLLARVAGSVGLPPVPS